ncbi:alpha/beta hydrolase [Streptomyces sp. NPDC089919]|uniref:alpha/beta hydrolase n=1 Tax=Streptomyces sp. NPDC089919 TaxID=3155188 RepID=UPI0034189F50
MRDVRELVRYGVTATVLSLSLVAPAPAGAFAAGHPAAPGGPAAPGAAFAKTPEMAGAAKAARRAATAGLAWRRCPAVEDLPPTAQCALLRVPLDYARPDGTQIHLTVSRMKATGKRAARQGSLVYNPGGPGASGMFFPVVGMLPDWQRVAAAYDLVGYAPRGVARSAPLSCESPKAFTHAPTQVPAVPSAAYKKQRIAAARAYAQGCARTAGAALRQYNTLNNVRDLDVLRAALGDRKLTFMGASYGTYLGALYATLYPSYVRRMVFDSVVNPDPSGIWYRNNLEQSLAFESRWRDFRAWAARNDRTYRLGRTPEAVQASYEKVRAAVARRPAGGVVGTGELQAAFLKTAYYDEYWAMRAGALSAFLRGDPSQLVEQAGPDPSTAAEEENANAVYTAVLCNDAPWPVKWQTWDRDNTALARRAPFETWDNAWTNLPCAFWPAARQMRMDVRTRPKALPPTLIVAAERDAATPYAGALELQRRLGGAALVTERAAGTHGVAGGRNACVDRHVERYLLTGATPGWRATCAPHPEPAPVSLDQRAAAAPRAALPPAV